MNTPLNKIWHWPIALFFQYEEFIMLNKNVLLKLSFGLMLVSQTVSATPIAYVYKAYGATPASIQRAVDSYRAALGQPNNGATPGSQSWGRREINWDGVPDSFSAPNKLPANFFNANSPRGVEFLSIGNGFQVSGKNGVAPVRFDNIRPGYAHDFQTFSPERLFTSLGNNAMEVHFFVPGSKTKAYVSGFGAVFTDVDKNHLTSIEYLSNTGAVLYKGLVPASPNGGLSFLGVKFNSGSKVAKVRITTGNAALNRANSDRWFDIVSMDDFLYSEPRLY